jgi:hypothetical protein
LGCDAGKLLLEEFQAILGEHKDRTKAPTGAKAIGLYLDTIEYPPHDDITKLLFDWDLPDPTAIGDDVGDDVEDDVEDDMGQSC